MRTLGEETILDFSTSYQVNDMFGIRLQINNLTDEPLRITRDNNTSGSARTMSTAGAHCSISRSSSERIGNRETWRGEAMLPAPFSWRNHELHVHCLRTRAALLPASPCSPARTRRAAADTAPKRFAGVDLSYVNEVEACGAQFRLHGQLRDPYELFAESGANLVRLRLWNNPDVD